MAEIDENLIRNELHYIERGELLIRRKDTYEKKHPETKPGVAGGKASGVARGTNEIISVVHTPSFTNDTASKLNVSPRSVELELQIANNLSSIGVIVTGYAGQLVVVSSMSSWCSGVNERSFL